MKLQIIYGLSLKNTEVNQYINFSPPIMIESLLTTHQKLMKILVEWDISQEYKRPRSGYDCIIFKRFLWWWIFVRDFVDTQQKFYSVTDSKPFTCWLPVRNAITINEMSMDKAIGFSRLFRHGPNIEFVWSKDHPFDFTRRFSIQ